MNTQFLLLAEFNTGNIPLRDCCEKYFGLAYPKAAKRALTQQLPVPAYRGGSQKSQWLVNAQDLAQFIDKEREKAKQHWQKMQSVA